MKILTKIICVLVMVASITCCVFLFVSNSKLQKENAEQQSQIEIFDGYSEDLAEALKQLQEANKRIKALEAERDQLKEQSDKVPGLEKELAELRLECERLENLIKSYEEIKNQTHEVSFYVGEQRVFNYAVKDGECFDENVLTDEFYSRLRTEYRADVSAWKLNNETVNFASLPITQAQEFKAEYKTVYLLTFKNGEEKECHYITEGTFNSEWQNKLTKQYLITPLEKEGYFFKGWSKDGINVIRIDDIRMIEDVTLTPIFVKAKKFTGNLGFYTSDKPNLFHVDFVVDQYTTGSNHTTTYSTLLLNEKVTVPSKVVLTMQARYTGSGTSLLKYGDCSYMQVIPGNLYGFYGETFTINFTSQGYLEITWKNINNQKPFSLYINHMYELA